jgi:hypothetical protein
MGAYCSVTNNTPSSTMYIKYGPDPTALRLAGAASGLFGSLLPLASYLGVSCSLTNPASIANGIPGASLSAVTIALDTDLIKQGYNKIEPGGVARSEKLTLGLRACATVVLVEVEKGWFGWLSGGEKGNSAKWWGFFKEGKVRARRGTLGCWAGPTDGSCNNYNVTSAEFEVVAVE